MTPVALSDYLQAKHQASLVRLSNARLDQVEHAFLATVISTLCDPEMADVRRRLRAGEITLSIESDEVTWIDVDQAAGELADELLRRAR